MKLSVTQAAIAARCERQFVLAREGLRVTSGNEAASIGTPAHEILAAFVDRGGAHPLLRHALAAAVTDERAFSHAVAEAIYRELFDRAAQIAPRLDAEDFVRLSRAVFDCAALLSELLGRAHRTGLRGGVAFAAALVESEKKIALDFAGVELDGTVDLFCRDLETNETYVFDLKTSSADAAAEEQARLYARALGAAAALACTSGGHFELRRVKPDPDLDARMRRLPQLASGEATPRAAAAATCAACPVRSTCWSRWGRTIEEPSPARPQADEVRRLEQALRAHRIHLEPIDPAQIRIGPTLVRYRIMLREGEGIARVQRAAADLQRAMGWRVPPLVQNDERYVALDAPRSDREVLPWRAIPLETLRGLEVPVGMTLDRQLLKLDLAVAPHVLAAGTTGSGKTVFLKALLLSLLRRSACEVVIVDPKMVDFMPFGKLKLARPVITDPQDAVAYLESLVDEELPRRTALLARAGVSQRVDLPAGTLPALVVVIDEFADLAQSFAERPARNAFLSSVQRLLQKSRAAGIHLVIATQRPSVDAIPGILKANLPARIAFRLPQAADSGTVLDQPGAENLLGHGDLLLKRDGLVTRAQGYFVTNQDIAP